MHYRPSSSISTENFTSPEVNSPPQYEARHNYDYETTTRHPGYQTASYTENGHPNGSFENI